MGVVPESGICLLTHPAPPLSVLLRPIATIPRIYSFPRLGPVTVSPLRNGFLRRLTEEDGFLGLDGETTVF